jgi:hypothetical protein
MNQKIIHYKNLYCPRGSLLLQESSKISKYNLTNPDFDKSSIKSKMIFKKEKPKIKESIFNLLRNTKKVQIRKEHKLVNKNKKTINNYISILNDAHIDEGIVLNKYFAYLKRYNVEYEKSRQIKLKQILIPIKTQEKVIRNMKKNMKFFKSISNHMIMKYMIDNKEKFNQYMNEISSYKTRNSLSINNHRKTISTEKNISISKFSNNNNKNALKTYSNYDENLRYINSYMNTDKNVNKNTISNLKLKIGDTLSSYSMKKNSKIKNKRKFSAMIKSKKETVKVNNKYFTPFKNRKVFLNIGENIKNNEIHSSRTDYRTSNYKFNND